MKIALRFVISLLNNFANWFDLMLKLQRVFNNNVVNIDHTFNEIVYDFISTQSNLISLQQFAKFIVVVDLRVAQRIVRAKINDVITLSQMYFKLKYDRKHQSLYMRVDDWVFFSITQEIQNFNNNTFEKKVVTTVCRLISNHKKNRSINLSFRYFRILTRAFCIYHNLVEVNIVVVDELFSTFAFYKIEFRFRREKHWSRQILWDETFIQQTSNDSSKNKIFCEVKKLWIKTR